MVTLWDLIIVAMQISKDQPCLRTSDPNADPKVGVVSKANLNTIHQNIPFVKCHAPIKLASKFELLEIANHLS